MVLVGVIEPVSVTDSNLLIVQSKNQFAWQITIDELFGRLFCRLTQGFENLILLAGIERMSVLDEDASLG